MTMSLVIAVLALTTAAALVQGSLGLGLGLIASPGLSLVNPAFVPGPILAAALLASIWTLCRDREHGVASGFHWTLVGIPLGIPLGIVLLLTIPTPVLMLSLGLMVLTLAPLTSMSRLAPDVTPRNLGVGGFLSAVAGSTVGLPGPTVAIVYQRLAPATLRMTMAVYLTIVQSIALVALAATGGISHEAAVLMTLTVPGTLIGLAISGPVATRLHADFARTAVLTVCCLAGASLTVRAGLDLLSAP